MTTIDFISIQGQQNFEHDSEINPRERKIENDKIQIMFEKYKKTLSNSLLKGYFFQVLLKMKDKKNICNHERINRCKI